MSAGSHHHHHHSDLTWIGQDRRLARRVGQPLARFLAVESASGVLLIIATIVALIWANSPWSEVYDDLLHLPINLEIGSFHFEESLLHFVNDGLMALFFFVVGLEIKREMTTGELRDPRAALLPAVAALGGMVVPAVLFVVVTGQAPASDGWGIPMATDIAFAVAMLAGIGFTVALFITLLAYGDEAIVTQAKMGTLVASTLAAILGASMLHRATRESVMAALAAEPVGPMRSHEAT